MCGGVRQIWLNLAKSDKMSDPHFKMIWADEVPVTVVADSASKQTTITTYAGALGGKVPPAPPPSSWAAKPDSHVAVWTLKLQPVRSTTGLPYSDAKVANRTVRDFGWANAHGAEIATPADFPRRGCSSYRELHVRRERLGFVHRSRTIFCRPVPTLRFAFHLHRSVRLASPQGATYTLPACACQDAAALIHRTLYFFLGEKLSVDGQAVDKSPSMIELRASKAVELRNDSAGECELLMLQVKTLLLLSHPRLPLFHLIYLPKNLTTPRPLRRRAAPSTRAWCNTARS